MKIIKHKKNKGVALVTVIMFCILLICMLSILFHNSRTKKGTHELQYDSTRALMAANTAVQLAVYKYRVLTAEYYRINTFELEKIIQIKNAGNQPEAEHITRLELAKNVWISDLITKNPPSINDLPNDYNKTVNYIKKNFENYISEEKKDIDFGIVSFDLISSNDDGYTKDYIKIKAWGSCNNIRKEVEEVIETSIVR